jgi:hypothetical protein|tara:strand:- start:308 stop:574 length:267 start_codon:yes stop_codon:yes gene_type:complete
MSDSVTSYWNRNDTSGTPNKPKSLKGIKDPIVESVKNMLTLRSKLGIAKYDTTLYDNKLTTLQWLQHLQEELLDGACYIERLKKDLDK